MEQLQETTQTAEFTPLLLGVVRQLSLSEIYVAGNYRESIDPTGLVELGQSIKNGGQLQPVLVRKLDQPIEGKALALVFGFRRYAASEDAQMLTIDAIVKELSEEDALAARIVENLQREVPHPLDEANAVADLTSFGKGTVEIASWLGKNPKWVAQRRELSKLLAEWKTLLRTDKVSLTAAEELCRWPIEVQERMLTKRYAYSRTEVSTVKGWLNTEIRNLSAAPWKLDDETLLPVAGACSACPKRSSCAVELFPTNEVKKDSCLDSECWATKMLKQIERKMDEVGSEEEPAHRISSLYYSPGNAALIASRYEVTKSKKGSLPAVLVDGPYAGHARRIKLIGTAPAIGTGSTVPEKTKGEKMKETRRYNLTKIIKKEVTLKRILTELYGPAEQSSELVYAMLAHLVEERLMMGTLTDETKAALVADWKWELPAEAFKYNETKPWVRAQIRATAPTLDKLTLLLVYVTARHNLNREYEDYQHTLVGSLDLPVLRDGLDAATTTELERRYDPQTLRLRKK